MNTIRNKHIGFCSLLLFYFAFYAISPLSYTYTAGKIADSICGANGPSSFQDNLNIFLLEVIFSKMDAKKDADQTDSTARVFLRKARAILPENTNLRSIPLDSITLSEGVTLCFYHPVSRIAAYSNRQHSGCEVNPLYSGPAPPSA